MTETPTSHTAGAHDEARLERLLGYLASDPGNDALRADAFDTALGAGDRAQAQALFDGALPEQQLAPMWRFRLGNLALAAHDWARAKTLFDDLRAEFGDNPGLAHNLAYIAFQSGDFARVDALLSPWIDLVDVDDTTRALWLRAAHHASMFRDALARARQWQASNLLGPQAAGVASLMAVDAAAFADVAPWAQFALQHLPEQHEALVALGSMALGNQQSDQAKQCFTAALRTHPEDGRAWSGMGFALLALLDSEGARSAFARAVKHMPSHIGTWHGKGWAALTTNDVAQARADFEHALSLDRNFADSHGAMAVVNYFERREDEARAAVARAFGLDRGCLTAKFAQAMLDGELSDVEAVKRMSGMVLARQARVLRGESDALGTTEQ
ncbi:tetratricopeptide repeat protein [Pandoraea bronchicola]|uniref:Beta-barrel assembly-enhancing protease n=1 Tax=Pandoraea bronchicola TaxID=2508287 RepID=A0A5E5BZE1_9BURK|nr:tetratricopeptide repeat protein [Pandoraea bronchicola]VVE90706.1 Beta-barrel assembly-enhancing protease [Pandoraea bronchicola]